jgi:hypothetical protein
MVQTIQARDLTLYDLKAKFGLKLADSVQFFREWLDDLPELTDLERQYLDRVKANYLHLAERPMLESIVKMVVLSPLLDLAGFYRPPFRVNAETSIQISAEDEGEIVRGQIDVLVVQDRLWVLAIESKGTKFSVREAIPQALAYMLASPNTDNPTFGLATNGDQFIFIKLLKQDTLLYALSDDFSLLRRENELYGILSVLKRLGKLLITNHSASY